MAERTAADSADTTPSDAHTDTTRTAYPYVATVHRPGLPAVHLGFHFAHQAEHAAWSLTSDLTNTAHVEGTTITWSTTPAGAAVLGPLPADRYALAEMIATAEKVATADRDLLVEHLFPDLFSQLKARRGYEEAEEIWSAACAVLDPDESDIDPADATEPETARLAADVVMLAERHGQLYVLLIERGNAPFQGRWAIPGGRVNRGEECEAAARRELREETGLEAVRLEEVGGYSKVGRDPRARYVSFAYVAKLDHMPAPVAGDDARAARWFPVAEILGQPERLAFDHAKILGDAIAHIHQDGTRAVSMNVGGNAHVGQVIGFSFGQGRP